MFLKAVTLAALCASPAALYAQNGRATLTGTVTDTAGAALQGAQITLDPDGQTTVTNSTGNFTFTGVNAGDYTLSINYSGFEAANQKVTVSAGQAARADVSLKVASGKDSVEVYSGRQGGEVEAINRTVAADNIINVLPADVIISLPNANVADAIGRLPSVTLERDEGEGKYVKIRGTEPRLTHTTLDGVQIASPETVRQIKLDLIPADLVESVQINKTLQANMEGDGIGGSVDLRTKSAEDRPTIFLESTGGYTPIIGGRPAYMFDGTVGRRFLEGKKLGALISGSYDWNGRGINDVEPGPALSGTYDLRDYRYFRDRRGFGGTLDYRISDTSSLYLKGLYSHFDNFGDDWIYTPTINTFVTATQGGPDGTMSFSALRRRPIQDIGGLQFGGHHVLGSAALSWNLNSSVGRTRDDGYSSASFAPVAATNPLNNVVFTIDVSNPLLPHINPTNGVNIFDPTKYFYQGQSVQNTYSPEVDLGFGASLAQPYSLAGHASEFEFGGLFRNEHKFENLNTLNYTPNLGSAEDPSLAMTNFIGDFTDPNYYGNNYKFGPAVSYEKVRAFAAQTITSRTTGNSFDQIEKVGAGYLMNTTNFARFRVNVGLRFESTGENNLGYLGSSSATRLGASPTPIRATGSYLDVLPSASVRYAITPASGLRLVYGRGLARPNFQDLVPYQSGIITPGSKSSISQGNPNLKAEYADNIDLLYEDQLPGTGLLQAGFFYKHLSNPIVPTQTTIALSGGGTEVLSQTINAGNAWVYGFEVAFQQHFTRLPGAFNGLGVSANYGYTASQITLPSTTRGRTGSELTPALIGQAPNSFNFSPTYDKRGLSVRLGMTYNQANIAAYSNNISGNEGPVTAGGGGGGQFGPNGDNYFYSHLQIDLQGTYRLPRGFTAVAYALNLNNEVFGFYNGSTIYPVQREFYRQTFGGGLRWSPRGSNR